MTFNGAIVAPPYGRPMRPAMACAAECAAAWADHLDLEFVDPEAPHAPANPDLWIVVAIDFRDLSRMVERIRRYIGRDAAVLGYVFDGFFSSRLNRLPGALRRHNPLIRSLRRFDRIFTPIASAIAEQARTFDLPLTFLPIGVDAIRFGAVGAIEKRWIAVNGYGRQPPALVSALADVTNRGGDRFFHYTAHAEIGRLLDPARHRDHFWQMLRHSRVALAYAPEAYDPAGRFHWSFVGQRWFEMLAAGCVVAGRRPTAPETADLLDWPDATIELPDEPSAAVEFLQGLSEDAERLLAQSRLNFEQCLRRHDWRWRAPDLLADRPTAVRDLAARQANLGQAVEKRISATG